MALSIENDEFTLGFVVCATCEDLKSIKQGRGKRKNFVHGRCACGPDTRTGAKAQIELRAFKPLEIVKAAIAAGQFKPNKPNNEQYEPNTNAINAQSGTKPEPNTNAINAQSDTKPQPNTNAIDLVTDTKYKPNTNAIDLVTDTKYKPNTNAMGLVTDTKPEPNPNAMDTKSKPNSDAQSKPNNEGESETLNLSKCVGIGSVIGLVFGLIIR